MFNFLIGADIPMQTIIMVILLVVLVAVLIVLPMFTNKRRNKAINDLHSSLRPGDVIKTVGGIVCTIKEIKEISPVDKEMVVKTGVGDNKTTMGFDIQAVYQILHKVDAPLEILPEEPVTETAKSEPEVTESVTEETTSEQEETKKEEIKAAEETAAPIIEDTKENKTTAKKANKK